MDRPPAGGAGRPPAPANEVLKVISTLPATGALVVHMDALTRVTAEPAVGDGEGVVLIASLGATQLGKSSAEDFLVASNDSLAAAMAVEDPGDTSWASGPFPTGVGRHAVTEGMDALLPLESVGALAARASIHPLPGLHARAARDGADLPAAAGGAIPEPEFPGTAVVWSDFEGSGAAGAALDSRVAMPALVFGGVVLFRVQNDHPHGLLSTLAALTALAGRLVPAPAGAGAGGAPPVRRLGHLHVVIRDVTGDAAQAWRRFTDAYASDRLRELLMERELPPGRAEAARLAREQAAHENEMIGILRSSFASIRLWYLPPPVGSRPVDKAVFLMRMLDLRRAIATQAASTDVKVVSRGHLLACLPTVVAAANSPRFEVPHGAFQDYVRRRTDARLLAAATGFHAATRAAQEACAANPQSLAALKRTVLGAMRSALEALPRAGGAGGAEGGRDDDHVASFLAHPLVAPAVMSLRAANAQAMNTRLEALRAAVAQRYQEAVTARADALAARVADNALTLADAKAQAANVHQAAVTEALQLAAFEPAFQHLGLGIAPPAGPAAGGAGAGAPLPPPPRDAGVVADPGLAPDVSVEDRRRLCLIFPAVEALDDAYFLPGEFEADVAQLRALEAASAALEQRIAAAHSEGLVARINARIQASDAAMAELRRQAAANTQLAAAINERIAALQLENAEAARQLANAQQQLVAAHAAVARAQEAAARAAAAAAAASRRKKPWYQFW